MPILSLPAVVLMLVVPLFFGVFDVFLFHLFLVFFFLFLVLVLVLVLVFFFLFLTKKRRCEKERSCLFFYK